MATATIHADTDLAVVARADGVGRKLLPAASTTTRAKNSAIALVNGSPTSRDGAIGHTAEASGLRPCLRASRRNPRATYGIQASPRRSGPMAQAEVVCPESAHVRPATAEPTGQAPSPRASSIMPRPPHAR